MNRNVSGIYKIQSKVEVDRCYIGSAFNIRKRWNPHLLYLRRGTHHSIKLQRHYNKYGEDDLVFEILFYCDKVNLLENEQYLIDTLNPWFNICRKAGSFFGCKHSEETKQKIREINTGKKYSEETKEIHRKRMMGNKYRVGMKLSEEQKMKLIQYTKGKKLGKRTIEQRRRISEAHKGQIPWNKGKRGIYSEETLLKMRNARRSKK